VFFPLEVWRQGQPLRNTLQLAGKLVSRGTVGAVFPGKLLHLQDTVSQRRFLVDTGASYSILPHTSTSPVEGPNLTGPSGTAIRCWGERKLSLSFDGRPFTWTFLLADVSFAILGVDF
jgi:hypothetical protein